MGSMRITGLASGLDTESIVQQLMSVEKMPLDTLKKKKIKLEWQRDAYRDINLQISALRESVRAKGLALQGTFLQKKITSSNENAITAVAVGNPPDVATTMEVRQIATVATWTGNKVDANVRDGFASAWSPDVNFVDGKATLKLDLTNPDGTVNKAEIEITENDSMHDVIAKIGKSNLGVTAFYDSFQEKIVLSNKVTGQGANISFGDPNSVAIMSKLGFSASGATADNNGSLSGLSDGRNAKFLINGFETERTSNTFTINSMTYTLKEVTTSPVTISSKQDTDKIYESVMSFVEDYNKLVDAINGKLKEDVNKSYDPLTDDEKKELTETQIKDWEKLAKSGLLRRDSILTKGLTDMRTAIYGSVSKDTAGIFTHLSQIGLVSSKDYMDGGKIVIDTSTMTMADGRRLTGEERLREAIEKNPEDVFKLFMADGEGPNEKGVLRRLTSSLDSTINAIAERAGKEGRLSNSFTIGKELDTMDSKIDRFEDRLKEREERYYAQYAALEKAMSNYNGQLNSLLGLLGQNTTS